MKYLSFLLLAIPAAFGQTGTASILGTVLDAETMKPVPAALVIATRAGVPPFTRNTKSGGDGAFQVQGLTEGAYSLCVQAAGDRYLDPCQWNGNATAVTLAAGQNLTGISLKLVPSSILNIQVRDAQKLLSQITKDGRRRELTLGAWGPDGLYHPAHASGSPSATGNPDDAIAYQIGDEKRLPDRVQQRRIELDLAAEGDVDGPGDAAVYGHDDP